MHQEVSDVDCVACGCEIRSLELGGETMCGHGQMHYNCSYLGMLCDECNRPLTINLQQQADAFATLEYRDPVAVPVQVVPIENIDRALSREEHQELQDSSHAILNELTELKRMLSATKSVIMNKLNELSGEVSFLKQKMLEQHNEILRLKLEAMEKEMKNMKTEE